MQLPSRTQCLPAAAASLALSVTLCGGLACDEGSDESDDFAQKRPLPGGTTTTDDRTSSAFENPAPNLGPQAFDRHMEGDVAFEATFVSTPAEVNPGLGPTFNNSSCNSCHIRNGRGLPVVGDGALGSVALVRVSMQEGEAQYPGGPIPVPGIGTQLHDHATYGNDAPATVEINWIEEQFSYPADGAAYSLRHAVVDITMNTGDALPGDVMVSLRFPPPVFGLGLLEAVAEEDLLALADPDDADSDGISGRPNYVWSVEHGGEALGRFGWKSNQPTLRQQAGVAYLDDMGVTTPMFPELDGSWDLDDDTMDTAAFYTQTLGVPPRGNLEDSEVIAGEELFETTGCEACHVSTLHTGDHKIESLRDQVIHPYTDLLLHNMGFDLADSRPDFSASGTEWRTPPLWGIGLVERVLGGAAYLHDGRARTLEEAILWHGGEAEAAKESFRVMAASKRRALLAFLRSL